MRALEPVHQQIFQRMQFLHTKRLDALWRAVQALVLAKRLWLTAMGRSWPTMAKRKHTIKAADRLLGNESLYADRFRIAASMAEMLLPKKQSRPVILVDTMEIRKGVIALTAAFAHQGRSLPIWSTTVGALNPSVADGHRFLCELKKILPGDCTPTLVTDGGFQGGWYDEVQKNGWHYVGRVRGTVKFIFQGKMVACKDLHQHATSRAKDLGPVAFPVKAQVERRLVLSKLPKSGHRRMKTRRGNDNGNNYKHYRMNAHEPLLLATSLDVASTQVVGIYKLRMQIEQSFRDLKNHRWGWSLRHCLTRSRKRIELLLLIAAIAMIAQHLVGMAAEQSGLHRAHQANTISSRRVLSFFYLGGLVLRDNAIICDRVLQGARRRLLSNIDRLRQ